MSQTEEYIPEDSLLDNSEKLLQEVWFSILSEKEYQANRGYILSGFKNINGSACTQLSQRGLDTWEGSLITEGASALVS